MEKKEKIVVALCAAATIAAGVLHYAESNAVLAFAVTAVALALLAVIVRRRDRTARQRGEIGRITRSV